MYVYEIISIMIDLSLVWFFFNFFQPTHAWIIYKYTNEDGG